MEAVTLQMQGGEERIEDLRTSVGVRDSGISGTAEDVQSLES